MKKLCELWRIRKQYDSIKLAIVLLLCAVYFLVFGTVRAVSYTKYLHQPVEYLLQAQSESASLDIAPSKLCDIKGVVSASFQRDFIITTDDQKPLSVSELSPVYLYLCYGIEINGSGKKVWLNPTAFDEVFGTSENSCMQAFYTADGKRESAEFIRCKALGSDTAYAVSVGTTSSFGNSQLIRVMFEGTDVTGDNVRKIEKLGYTVSDKEAILTQSYEQEKMLSELKYCAVSMVLSLIGTFAFVRIYHLKSQSCE